jgi:hypothetical protein
LNQETNKETGKPGNNFIPRWLPSAFLPGFMASRLFLPFVLS